MSEDKQEVIALKRKIALVRKWMEYMGKECVKAKAEEFSAKFLDRLEVLWKRITK